MEVAGLLLSLIGWMALGSLLLHPRSDVPAG